MSKRVFSHMFTRLLLVDTGIAVGGTVTWLLHLDVRDLGGTVALCAAAFVLHVAIWALHLRALLMPLQTWARKGRSYDDRELLAMDAGLERLPLALSLSYSLSFLVYFGTIAAVAWYALPEVLAFGRIEITSMAFQFMAIIVGAPMPVLGWVGPLLGDAQAELGAELARRDLDQSRTRASLVPQLVVLALGLVMATAFWLLGESWLSQGHSARELTQLRLERAAHDSAWKLSAGASPADALEPGSELVPFAELPPALEALPEAELGVVLAVHDSRSEQITAAAALGEGSWVVARAKVDFDRRTFWIATGVVLLALSWWALASIIGQARTLTGPLRRLHRSLRRVVEVGDLREQGRIPAVRHDEIGQVVHEFNAMLDVFEELAGAAQTVARGDLRVEIQGRGDLQDAFRNMVARLAELVAQIRDAAVEVASASTEIHAATQGQEQAANAQSEGVRAVSRSMQRLVESASSISLAASEVLDNASHTGSRADEVGARLTELNAHIARVGELLELIREVADRSNLLALNGSLEATRAGEAGRGFALVAAEMRRLAERVTRAVSDVHATITDVSSSSVATAAATAQSRDLAEGTTLAARQIVSAVETQRSETERVSTRAGEIADVVTSAVAATTQTRATADGLREQAAQLERLIGRFEVEGSG